MAIQYLTTATEMLKDDYLSVFNDQISVEPSVFLEMIQKGTLGSGGKIKSASRYGINGGFGMSAEGVPTPAAMAQIYKNFEMESKDMYCDLGLSNKTLVLARTDKNAFFDAYNEEIKGSYLAAKWNMGRMLFGNGIGKLGSFSSALAGVTAVTLDDVSKLIEGLAVDFYNVNGSTETLVSGGPYRILYVNRKTKAITINAAVTTTHGGFITNQNSYNREITGLGAIFDTTNVTSIYGHDRASNEWLNPLVEDADHDVSTSLLFDAVSNARQYRDTKINTILMGDNAFSAWYKYMEETHINLAPSNRKFASGSTGYELMVRDRIATIFNESFIPSNEIWCVDKDMFHFISTPWDFCDQHTGGAFTLVPGGSYYRALLASYGDLICELPGGCIRITNADRIASSHVTGISISPTTKTLTTTAATQQITVTLSPTNPTNTQCKYTSTDTSAIVVSDTGLISVAADATSVKNGTYMVIVSTVDGGYTAICTVTLNLA